MLLFILFFLNKVLELLYRKYILVSFHKCENVHLRVEETLYHRFFLTLISEVFNLRHTHTIMVRAITEEEISYKL